MTKATKHSELGIATAKRLATYGIFSDATLEAVASLAEKQIAFTSYQDFFKSVHMPPVKMHVTKKGSGVPVVDIPARQKEAGVLAVHLPMSNPLDENQLYHIATLASLLPAYRIIGFGNPSGALYNYPEQNLTFLRRLQVAFTKNARPLVEAELDYLQKQALPGAYHIGYSYGAAKALLFSTYAPQGSVQGVTFIDPVAHPRGLRQLIHDFKETFHALGAYVNRTNIPTYFEARNAAAKTKHHKDALRRQINIAIGFVMARLDFIPVLEKALARHTAMSVSVAWGTNSELGNDAHMKTTLHQLSHDLPGRVHALRLKDDEHALANDIHLYGAIVYESLERAGLKTT